MFTGIIEAEGIIKDIVKQGGNRLLKIQAPFVQELRIDQSIAHNGVCLTVINISKDSSCYEVIAIEETLSKSNFGLLCTGDKINLERCVKIDGRLDGHIVQGHVDQTGICSFIKKMNGSYIFGFMYDSSQGDSTVKKGSICINGVSLTVVDSNDELFSVAIIPYTYMNTNFSSLKVGDIVNLEFDIIGKYVKKYMRNLNIS